MAQRLVDVGVSVALFMLLAPALAIISLLIRRDSRGSVLYVPAVVGQGGRLFPLLRFRTMHPDHAKRSSNERLTRVGRVLRTSSLDHLPMVINVLVGDMTLVGPRPMEREAVDLTDPTWQTYVRAKPGIINYAVLTLGSSWTPLRTARPTLNQELEISYAERRSVWTDLRLSARACWALILSRGNVKARKPPDIDVSGRPNNSAAP